MGLITRRCALALLLGLLPCGGARADELESADRLFKAGKWQQARESYEQALPVLMGNDAARVLRQIGYTWQIQHQHDQAVPYFERVLAMKDIEAEHVSGSWLRLGYSLRLLKRGKEGIAALEKAVAVDGAPPTHIAEALLFAAWEHNTRKETDAALAKLGRIESIPNVHANYIATAQLSVGRILQERKRYEAAINAYRRIDELNPVAAVNRARARVYVKECEALLAGDTAFHIKPYVIKVTETTARLLWVSQGNNEPGEVTVRTAAAKPPVASPPEVSPIQDTTCHLHAVTLEELFPGTRYDYVVASGGQNVAGSFKTAPSADTSFSFSLIGDTQSYHEGLQPLLDTMSDDDTDFVLHVGDITDRGNLWGEWKASFFDPGNNYLRDRAFWPVYGNHDGGPYFPTLFELPKRYWYSFDWGDAHVIVLDSYGGGSGGRGRAEQLAWLKADLQAADKSWTIVALHVPMVATRKSLKWFGEDDFLPLLEEHEVDVVLSGHHPHYRRYYPIGTRSRKPVLHITSGGGGGPVGGYVPSPLLAQGINVNHYCTIHVTPEKFTLSAHALSGAEIDHFELVKAETQSFGNGGVETQLAKEVIGLYQELLTDRSFDLLLAVPKTPAAGESVELVLDLSKLPRGPLDAASFDDDETLIIESTDKSPWQVARQKFPLRKGVGRFQATVPDSVSLNGRALRPHAHLKLQLRRGDRAFEPIEVNARLFAAE